MPHTVVHMRCGNGKLPGSYTTEVSEGRMLTCLPKDQADLWAVRETPT
jgi:hypothetical protein